MYDVSLFDVQIAQNEGIARQNVSPFDVQPRRRWVVSLFDVHVSLFDENVSLFDVFEIAMLFS